MDEKEAVKLSADDPMVRLIRAIHDLDWTVAVPVLKTEDDSVPGLIIGTEEYVDAVVQHLPNDLVQKMEK